MASLRKQADALRRALLTAGLCGLLALAISAPLVEESLPDLASGYRRLGYGIAAIVALIGLWPFADWRRLSVIPWPLVAALAWCWLSLTWSAAPDEALVRLILTTLVAWIAFATVRHLGYTQSLLTIRVILALALLLNYVSLLLYPQWSIGHGRYMWTEFQWLGLMAHKNFAGALCAFTVLVFLFDVQPRWRMPFLAVAAAAAVFVAFTASRTAMISGVAGLIAGGVLLATHHRIGVSLVSRSATWRIAGYGLLALFMAALLFLTFEKNSFLGLMADPDALSRRTLIWRQLVQAYLDQPWSGVGFGSYWTAAAEADLTEGRGAWLGALDQGHNGILDILVQVGLPGLLLVLLAMIVWPVRMLSRQINHAPQSTALFAALLVLCLGANATESGLLARDSVWSVLLLLTLALIAAVARRLDQGSAIRIPRDSRRTPLNRPVRRRRRSSDISITSKGTTPGRRPPPSVSETSD